MSGDERDLAEALIASVVRSAPADDDDAMRALRDYLVRGALQRGDVTTALALRPALCDKVSGLLSECLGRDVKVGVREVE